MIFLLFGSVSIRVRTPLPTLSDMVNTGRLRRLPSRSGNLIMPVGIAGSGMYACLSAAGADTAAESFNALKNTLFPIYA